MTTTTSTGPQPAKLTGDEYMALLLERQAEYMAAHDTDPRRPPLLEWFVRDGDEELFTPPAETAQPKKVTTPRRYKSSTELEAKRDVLLARRDRIGADDCGDGAVVNLSPHSRSQAAARAGRRRFAAMDRDLQRYTELTKQIDALKYRIRAAKARERKATEGAA